MKLQTLTFEKKSGIPIYKQLYEKLRADILNGHVKHGDQLMSIRLCEKQWKISRTSIERAYELLLLEGYIISIPQKGYYVDVDEKHRGLRKQLMDNTKDTHHEIIRYDFRSQTMDKDAFDITLWKRYLKDVLDRNEDIMTYGDPQGELSLRIALKQYGYAMRGVFADPKNIVIGASFQSLLYQLCGFLGDEQIIGLEESGFIQAEQVFHDYQIPFVKLSSYQDGVSIEELKAHHISVLYVNAGSVGSNHQPLSVHKRKEILAWAQECHAIVIEDDHNGELRYASKSHPCMQSFDMGEHVIYIGSFSKLLLPSLRISYLVLNQELSSRYDKSCYGPSASKIEQLALASYILDGHMERHVKRLRKRYEAKSRCMLELLQRYDAKADYVLEESALQLIVRFHEKLDIDAVIALCQQKQMRLNKNAQNELVLSFAGIAIEQMEQAIQELSELWNSL